MKNGRNWGLVIVGVAFAVSTGVFADNATPAAAQPSVEAAPVQVALANPQAPVLEATATDPLHSDVRWPLFKNCIDNTATPAAFEACLQMAFLNAEPDGQVLALLTH